MMKVVIVQEMMAQAKANQETRSAILGHVR